MSKKTMKQRIALVAVSALGFGLLSLAPVNAAGGATSGDGQVTIVGTSSICYAADDAGTTIAADTYDANTKQVRSHADGRNITVPVGGTLILEINADDLVVLSGPIAAINLNFDAADLIATQSLNAAGKVVLDNPGADEIGRAHV